MTPSIAGARALWLQEHHYSTEAMWDDLTQDTRDWWIRKAGPVVDAILGAMAA